MNHAVRKKTYRFPLLASIVFSSCLISLPLLAQNQPDNSAQNKQQQITADQQSTASSDRHLTAQIRKSLMADKSLSMYAHNIKIITAHGSVTLKGPVKSDEEKQEIASKAAQSAGGTDKVDNQLTVKGES